MKLRLQSNSLRLRLGKSEVARLLDQGAVEETVSFQAGVNLIYRIQSHPNAETLRAAFETGTITVNVPTDTAEAWAAGDEVGFYAQDGGLKIAIEKDFRCLTRAEEEPDAFPHPTD
jgi:hypothetical protein